MMQDIGHDKSALSKLLIALIVVVVVVVAVVAVVLLGALDNNRVRITVECTGGSWTGAYGDSSSLNTWTGTTGTKEVVIERPPNTPEWTVVANALMISGSGSVTVTISTMDGRVLDRATASGMFSLAQAQAKL